MKKLLATLSLLFLLVMPLTFEVSAQTTNLPVMEGAIGKYKIKMKLSFDNEKQTVTGWYYYKSKGAANKIRLKGKFKEDTEYDGFTMTETVGGKVTGTFDCEYSWGTGALAYGGEPFISVSGTFTNASGKEFDFEVSNF